MKKLCSIALVFCLTTTSLLLLTTSVVMAGDVYNSNESPVNGTTYYPGANITISVVVNQISAGSMEHYFFTNVSGSWKQIKYTEDCDIAGTGETLSDHLSGFNGYNKKYFWSSNLTNTNATKEWDNNTYFLYTRATTEPTTYTTTTKTYRVTFIVKDQNETPIQSAQIDIDDNLHKTNVIGQKNVYLKKGDYQYIISSGSYDPKVGSVTVDKDKIVTVIMGAEVIGLSEEEEFNYLWLVLAAAIIIVAYRLYTRKRIL